MKDKGISDECRFYPQNGICCSDASPFQAKSFIMCPMITDFIITAIGIIFLLLLKSGETKMFYNLDIWVILLLSLSLSLFASRVTIQIIG